MLGRSMKFSAGAMALLVSFPAGAAPAPIVDTKSTSTATNVSREQLDNLPAGRRLDDLIRTCPSTTIPTVTRQPQMLVDGVPTSPSVTLECIQPTDVEMIEVYKEHNAARAIYGAPPLAWDPFLVLSAGEYVGTLARTGKLVHASREGRGTVRENISQGLPSWSIRQLMGNWTKEKQNFVPGIFPNVSTTGDWYQVGHWTQMIWAATTLIGCAKALGIGSSWLVCRYNPGGNKDGKQVGIPPLSVAQVEQPPLPNTEVFNRAPVSQPAKTEPKASSAASLDDGMMGRRASLFDLGIYAGGAYTTDWFDIGDDHPGNATTDLAAAAPLLADILTRDDGATTVGDINQEYGYDGALFVGYDFGAFRLEAEVAYKTADLESFDTDIRLPGETPQPPPSGDDMMGRRVSLFDLGIYAGGAYTTDWFDIPEASVITPSPHSINWAPIEDLLFRGSWAEGFDVNKAVIDGIMNEFSGSGSYWSGFGNPSASYADVPVETWGEFSPGVDLSKFSTAGSADNQGSKGSIGTAVQQPTLPTTEVFNQAGGQPKVVKPGQYEPSNENLCTAWRFFDAEKMYREAKAKGDAGAMITAKAHMAQGIMNQYEAVEAAVEVGEMAKVPAYGLADFLGKMMESYKELTGELPPGYYEPPNGFELDEGIIKPVDSAVEQPELPTMEVFKPDEQNRPRCDDVM
ncbi:MAG TPA: CAP domain-containing protein [Sphingomicrobium sp.]|nr:CAP domain-containing protein [Sphingomicrobium sp.]